MTLNWLALGLVLTFLAVWHPKSRRFLLFTFSILAVYALQPSLPIRHLDFWLPFTTLGLTLWAWVVVSSPAQVRSASNLLSAGWIMSLSIGLSALRYLPWRLPLTASFPPSLGETALGSVFGLLLAVALLKFPRRLAALTSLLILLAALITLKSPLFSAQAAALLRSWNHQDTLSATAWDIRWLGFSYIVFRLLHTLQDFRKARAAPVNLQEYVTFILFYPALAAGPIDRLERFVRDLRTEFGWQQIDWDFVLRRLTTGLFKKFILADSLALISLTPQNAVQIQSAAWAWVMLYAYALQIYFDFSGYTDLALALGRMAGISLPENFRSPYAQPNLAQFWNNWHMSLTQWFQAYVFNPLTRALRRPKLPAWVVILLTQVITMTLIGLWHGMTLNFALWGLWHGLGLFGHNRWQSIFRARVDAWSASSALKQKVLHFSGAALTFQFVALGWVWFCLPNFDLALFFWKTLLGLGQ